MAAHKRRYPFEENVPLQLKVHISDRVIADKEEMERVYAHTKALLFKGANPNTSDKTLQTIGGMNGFVNGSHKLDLKYTSPKKPSPPSSCSHFSNGSQQQLCPDCDGIICYQCARQCNLCEQHFCHYCTVLNYDLSAVVRAFCLTCLPSLKEN